MSWHVANSGGVNVRWWDFVFYMLFGLAVTSFVHIGGVLLVFSYLVVPAVCAAYLVNSMLARFAGGWAIATLASGVSLLVTAKVDLPIGAAIVCVHADDAKPAVEFKLDEANGRLQTLVGGKEAFVYVFGKDVDRVLNRCSSAATLGSIELFFSPEASIA